MHRGGWRGISADSFGEGIRIADQPISRLFGGGSPERKRPIDSCVPSMTSSRRPEVEASASGSAVSAKAQALLLLSGLWGSGDSDMAARSGQPSAAKAPRVGVLLGEEPGAADRPGTARRMPWAARRPGNIAGYGRRTRSAACSCTGGGGRVYGRLVVLALVAEEIPLQSDVEDLENSLRSFEVLLEVDPSARTRRRMISGDDAEHFRPQLRQRAEVQISAASRAGWRAELQPPRCRSL